MKKVIGILAILSTLSGCMSYVTKENSATFETWELCTLLHDPYSLYSDWIPMEDENSDIRAELAKRGVVKKSDCNVSEIAKKTCIGYGFKSETTEFSGCRLDVEHHVRKMKQMKKAAHDAEQAAENMQAQQIINNMNMEQIKQNQQWQDFRLQQLQIQQNWQ